MAGTNASSKRKEKRTPKISRKPPSITVVSNRNSRQPQKNTIKVTQKTSTRFRKPSAKDDAKLNKIPLSRSENVKDQSKKRKRHRGNEDGEPSTKRRKNYFNNAGVLNPVPDRPLVLYVCGAGSEGELGLGYFFVDFQAEKKPCNVCPCRVDSRLRINRSPAVGFATGYQHMLALTSDNKILSWGCESYGAPGRNTTSDRFQDPLYLVPPEKYLNPLASVPGQVDVSHLDKVPTWSKLVAGKYFSCALTTDGRVYAWGTFKQADSAPEHQKQPMRTRPTLIPGLENIVHIAAGHNHLLAADKHHKIYTWGGGVSGQLGRANADDESEATTEWLPREVNALDESFSGVRKLACGATHCLVLDHKGRLYGWGANVLGQVDPEILDGVVEKPQLLPSLRNLRFIDVAAGDVHSLACQGNGTLTTWGKMHTLSGVAARKTITPESLYESIESPCFLLNFPDVPKMDKVAAGHNHSIAIAAKGNEICIWGENVGFATGHDSPNTITIPTLLRKGPFRYPLRSGTKWRAAGGGYGYSVFARDSRTSFRLCNKSLLLSEGACCSTDDTDTSHGASAEEETDQESDEGEKKAQEMSARTSRESAPSPEPSLGGESRRVRHATTSGAESMASVTSNEAKAATEEPVGPPCPASAIIR